MMMMNRAAGMVLFVPANVLLFIFVFLLVQYVAVRASHALIGIQMYHRVASINCESINFSCNKRKT